MTFDKNRMERLTLEFANEFISSGENNYAWRRSIVYKHNKMQTGDHIIVVAFRVSSDGSAVKAYPLPSRQGTVAQVSEDTCPYCNGRGIIRHLV